MSTTIYFEGREVSPQGEPVSEKELTEYSIYYLVNFIDEKTIIPVMRTVVFVGKNLEPDDVNSFYFQDIDSYHGGKGYEHADSYADFLVCSAQELKSVYDLEHALERLIYCFLQQARPGAGA